MSIRINVHMSKIVRMPMKVDAYTYATYENCQTLNLLNFSWGDLGWFVAGIAT